MKHAFLIIAHNNWWQLKQLIQLLDYENNDMYIHIDLKCSNFKEEDFQGIAVYSRVQFYQKYKVYWGGYSIIQTELFLIDLAHKVGYDYYHLLSGADLPLKPMKQIHYFFEKNKGVEFIDYDEEKLSNDPEILRRTRLYHVLQNYRRRYKIRIINEFFTFCERILLVLQICTGVNRVKKLDWTIKYGSNWVSITDNLSEKLLMHSEKIYEVFHCTNCADELFIQTVAYNCGFKDKIYRPENNQAANLRYIDWKRGANGNPYIFRIKDLELLENNDALFARKFSEIVDKDIINQVISMIGEKKFD